VTRADPRAPRHAVCRYLARVDSSSTYQFAQASLEELVRKGRSSPKGRHWTRGARPHPGRCFVIWVERPDVVAIVDWRNGQICTVLSRSMFSRAIDFRAETRGSKRDRRPEPKAPARWRHSDQLSARAEAGL
jgi:hypothetical protein